MEVRCKYLQIWSQKFEMLSHIVDRSKVAFAKEMSKCTSKWETMGFQEIIHNSRDYLNISGC